MSAIHHILLAVLATTGTAAIAAPEAPKTEISQVSATELPAAVMAVVRQAMPEMTVTEAELKVREGRRYYDVEGKLPNGDEIELDILQEDEGWKVVEIQRDIAWAEAPAAVRSLAAAQPKAFEPVRVIESRQTDGSVIYELFAANRPDTPSREIMLKNGAATVLDTVWPH